MLNVENNFIHSSKIVTSHKLTISAAIHEPTQPLRGRGEEKCKIFVTKTSI